MPGKGGRLLGNPTNKKAEKPKEIPKACGLTHTSHRTAAASGCRLPSKVLMGTFRAKHGSWITSFNAHKTPSIHAKNFSERVVCTETACFTACIGT